MESLINLIKFIKTILFLISCMVIVHGMIGIGTAFHNHSGSLIFKPLIRVIVGILIAATLYKLRL